MSRNVPGVRGVPAVSGEISGEVRFLCCRTKNTGMKNGQILFILALLATVTCLALPVMGADGNQTSDEATIYYNTGERLLAANNFESAIASFDQALAANTTMIKMSDALLYSYRDKAYAQIQLNQFDAAIQTIDQGLALYPKDTMLWNNKGYALYKLQRYDQAVAAYDQALATDKTYTKGLINKGDALYQQGKFAEAVDTYKKALETNEGNPNATTGLALAEKGAANAAAASQQMTLVLVVIVVIVVAGGVVWFLKFRKPAEVQKPVKGKAKAKKKK